jgi:hypothetical protein
MSVPLEHLSIHRMASGENCLLLTEQISWDEYPDYADAIVRLIGGSLGERIDSGGERVWRFDRAGLGYWITWDDMDPGVSIEPCNPQAGAELEAIRDVLLRARPGSSA